MGFLPTTTMLTSITSSLRPSFSLATRALATTNVVRQQPNYSEDGAEQVFRPSNVQSKRMDDVGTRSIFTPEQDMFRESVRKFMQDTLAPQQEAFEKAGEPTREAWKAMGAQGLIGVSTPAEVGGIGGTFIDQCMELHEAGKCGNELASMAKYWTTELENKVAADCLQLHGGWGFMWETQIAKAYASARVQTIYGGTNEIMKELIARSIVKEAA